MTNQKAKVSPETEEKLTEKLNQMRSQRLEQETEKLAFRLGFNYIKLVGFPIAPEALRLISEEEASKLKIVCFFITEKEAKLASPEPDREETKKFLIDFEADHTLKPTLFVISKESFDYVFKLYKILPEPYQLVKGIKITEAELLSFQDKIKTFKDLNQEIQKASMTDLITLIIASAIKSRASDIHIEAEEEDIKVRFRIDGVLLDTASINKRYWLKIIARIKLLASLKINVTDRPQDGRFTIYLTKDRVDLRISCLPTAYGESVVARLLRSSAAGLKFEDLGLRDEAYKILDQQVERPNGMVVTTGPTGSGKTTTLYAILNKLNDQETKIITLEDPIEYRMKGINQSQVDPSRDYTFAKGLRSILRQDPDVVMVGEIRDQETAEIAIQAALTGHMVISTLHTNDAAGAIPRLLSMGVKPFLLAPAINAIIGQRLCRKICQKCKEEEKLPEDKFIKVKKILDELPEGRKVDLTKVKFFKGKGCEDCQGLGYHGRLGIYEVLMMAPGIEKEILSGSVSEFRMRELAKEQKMIFMVQDGLFKAIDGITSVEEIFRVIE